MPQPPTRNPADRSAEPASDAPVLRPETWLDAYGDRLYRYALARLRSRDAAEDAVQDALLAAVNARHSFDGRSSESTWLFGILRHKIYDILRRRAREANWRRDLEQQTNPTTAACVHTGQWPDAGVSDGEREEFGRVLQEAVERLPDGMREAFFLSEIDGIRSSEVCAILDISPANLWTLRYRARQRLRQDLDQRWFQRDPSLQDRPQQGRGQRGKDAAADPAQDS